MWRLTKWQGYSNYTKAFTSSLRIPTPQNLNKINEKWCIQRKTDILCLLLFILSVTINELSTAGKSNISKWQVGKVCQYAPCFISELMLLHFYFKLLPSFLLILCLHCTSQFFATFWQSSQKWANQTTFTLDFRHIAATWNTSDGTMLLHTRKEEEVT